MSINNLLKSISIIGLGAIFGYSSVKFFDVSNNKNRQIASMTYSKLGSEQFSKTLFDIKINNEKIGATQNDVSEVTVTIESYKAFPAGLLYSWSLPEHVTIIEGLQSGALEDFSANQKKQYTLKIKGYSKETKSYLSFKIEGDLDSKKIQRDILISSRPEDSFEYLVQQHEKAKNDAAESKGLKKLSGKNTTKPPVDVNQVSF